jgi:hypothetical protein
MLYEGSINHRWWFHGPLVLLLAVISTPISSRLSVQQSAAIKPPHNSMSRNHQYSTVPRTHFMSLTNEFSPPKQRRGTVHWSEAGE